PSSQRERQSLAHGVSHGCQDKNESQPWTGRKNDLYHSQIYRSSYPMMCFFRKVINSSWNDTLR
ncbi:MAG TPA: hypothetical protein VMW38_22030, partial [Terriglobia bacterium]|nr:hypothetical protein [Terriglobia bacterium]